MKLPPKEKVYEAWTALADNRVDVVGPGEARVASSDGSKSYTVRFSDNKFSSTDNGTFWQGYPGYPVLALLMLRGQLPFDADTVSQWSGINWTELNKRHRNNYAAAVAEVEHQRHIDSEAAAREADKAMEALSNLDIEIKRKI